MKLRGRKKVALVLVALAALPLAYLTYAFAQRQATRPRRPATSGPATIAVKAGDNLQAALDRARPGDEVVLEAGATFVGNFVLPFKAGDGFITVRSSRLAELPEGRRVTPADAARMARVSTPGAGPAVLAPPRSHHWRLLGLEITQAASSLTYDLVQFGDGDAEGPQDTLEEAPRHLVLDRCYVHAFGPQAPLKRGVALNSAHTSVTNSHVSGVKVVGQETQALAGWNGPGPFHVENNYLEAAGINILFGGAPPTVRGMVPSDIVVRGNHLYKPLSWKLGDPAYTGTRWTVKNLLELKSARRAVIEGNLLEHSWADAQIGWAVIFNTANDSGEWSRIEDIEFRSNVIRGAGNGVNLRGRDEKSGVKMSRVRVENNLLTDLGEKWGGYGIAFQVLRGPSDVTIEHNTADAPHAALMFDVDDPAETADGLSFVNNVVRHGHYGVFGSGGAMGADALERFSRRWKFAGNVMAGADPGRYPAGNLYPPAFDAKFFADAARGNYRVAHPRFKGRATDGTDPGCDFDKLEAALAWHLKPPAAVR